MRTRYRASIANSFASSMICFPINAGATTAMIAVLWQTAIRFAATQSARTLQSTDFEYYKTCVEPIFLKKHVSVGGVPGWLALTPKMLYVANSGSNSVSVVDTSTRKEMARIPVGQVPKRNGMEVIPGI